MKRKEFLLILLVGSQQRLLVLRSVEAWVPLPATFFAQERDRSATTSSSSSGSHFSSPHQSFSGENDDFANQRKEFMESMEGLKLEGNVPKYNQLDDPAAFLDPIMDFRPEDLEAFAESKQKQNSIAKQPLSAGLDADDKDGDDDALFLDADLYVKARDRINSDGSIRQADNEDEDIAIIDEKYREVMQKYMETMASVESPDTLKQSTSSTDRNDGGGEPTMDDLWDLLRARGPNPTYDPVTAEELHRQVFAEEEGHLQQSKVFRDSLLDSSKANEAAAERRGRAFRERQEQVIKELDQQIKDFENTTMKKLRDPSRKHCSKCKCLLSQDELTAAQSRLNSSRDSLLLCRVCYKDVLVAASQKDSSRQAQTNPKAATSSQFRARRSMRPLRRGPGSNTENRREIQIQQQPQPSFSTRPTARAPPSPQIRPRLSTNTRVPLDATNKTSSSTQQPQKPKVPSPWLEVVDPDTKEVFYWNEETEEMRWELDDE